MTGVFIVEGAMKSKLLVLVGAASLAAVSAMSAFAHDKVIGLFEFDQVSGSYPNGGVITDRSGTVFGTTSFGGNGPCLGRAGCGTVFALSPPSGGSGTWNLNVLYNFQGGQDGASPQAQLTLGPNGSLFGFDADGSQGTVFQLSPPATQGAPWTFQVIYVFTNGEIANLADTYAPLIWHHDALYGIAFGGSKTCGQFGCGGVFRLKPPTGGTGSWILSTLYKFKGGASGGQPSWIAGLDSSGALYVSTLLGNGAVAQISPPTAKGPWTETVLTTFNGGNDGSGPTSLVLMPNDTLYGIANANKGGVAFALGNGGSGWTRTNIARIAHGRYGPNSLAAGTNGSLIGTIWGDVDFFPGAVFQLTPPVNGGNWAYTELATFDHGPDRNPVNVVTGKGGHLFGDLNGGDSGFGGLFELR
jgi:hypothetical protein